MTKEKKDYVNFSWFDIKSIERAEKKKLKLENSGYKFSKVIPIKYGEWTYIYVKEIKV